MENPTIAEVSECTWLTRFSNEVGAVKCFEPDLARPQAGEDYWQWSAAMGSICTARRAGR